MPRYTDIKANLRLSLCAVGAALCGAAAALSSGCGEVDPISYISIPVPTITLNISPSVLALLSALPSGTWTLPSNWQAEAAAALASGIPTAVPSAFASYAPSNSAANPTGTTLTQQSAQKSAPASFEACALCHGPHGEGAGTAAPEIQHEPAGFAQWVVRSGRGGMPAHNTANLPDPKLSEIIAYLGTTPRPTTGAALYQDLCASCHGADAAGKTGRGPSLKGEAASVANRVRIGAGGTNYAATNYMPAWTSAELSDAEVQAITTFLK
jgi:mono/diheme cytochrome c family protein